MGKVRIDNLKLLMADGTMIPLRVEDVPCDPPPTCNLCGSIGYKAKFVGVDMRGITILHHAKTCPLYPLEHLPAGTKRVAPEDN